MPDPDKVTLPEDLRRRLARDMALNMRDVLGSGYITEFYVNEAGPITATAEHYIRESVEEDRRAVLADLRERLVWADANLRHNAETSEDVATIRRLEAKAEGVRLALSYLDEATR